jgi:hypothetical protein
MNAKHEAAVVTLQLFAMNVQLPINAAELNLPKPPLYRWFLPMHRACCMQPFPCFRICCSGSITVWPKADPRGA